MDQETQERFVEAWGTMGALWGINRSMARVHALLIATEPPLSLDSIAERLRISRGNASMCLRDLRSWGVVRRLHLPGDRRDFYVTEPDVWAMLFRIVQERKRREFDPAREAVREALAAEGEEPAPAVAERLRDMADLLDTADHVLRRVLANPATSRAMLSFLAGLPNLGGTPD